MPAIRASFDCFQACWPRRSPPAAPRGPTPRPRAGRDRAAPAQAWRAPPATPAGGGSGLAGTTGIGGFDLAGTGGGGGRTCGLQTFDLERKPAEILLLLDRSASMKDPPDGDPAGSAPKWDLIIPAVKQVIMDTDMSVHWGLKVFPEGTGSECIAGSVTNKIDVPIAPMNASTRRQRDQHDAWTKATARRRATPSTPPSRICRR